MDVPINNLDAQGIPIFDVHDVPEEISSEDLAICVSVDLNKYKYNNAIEDDPIPKQGMGSLYIGLDRPTRKFFLMKD